MENVPALLNPGELSVPDYVDKLTAYGSRLPQVECPVIHRFGRGVYIREASAPAGSYCIGHWHKTRCWNVFLKGRVTMLNENGTTSELKAPMMFLSNPGRKCVYVHEDMVWQNIFATNETDVEKLEEQLLDKGDDWAALSAQRLKLASARHEADREDYQLFLSQYGYTQERVEAEMAAEPVGAFPDGTYRVVISDSPIHGKGLFATGKIAAGEPIVLATFNGVRTPAGRYTNHSPTPNARPVPLDTPDVGLVATRDIACSRGGVLGEEITIDYRAVQPFRRVRR